MHICMFSGGVDNPKAFRLAYLGGISDSRRRAFLLPRALFPQEDVDSIFVPAVG